MQNPDLGLYAYPITSKLLKEKQVALPIKTPIKKLGIVMGGGKLPEEIISVCQKKNIPFVLIGIKNQSNPATVEIYPHIWADLGKLKKVIKELRSYKVSDMILAGYIHKNSLWTFPRDWLTFKVFLKIFLRFFQEDGLLKKIIHFIESQGMKVRGAQDIYPELLVPTGRVGKHMPLSSDLPLIEEGMRLAHLHGLKDRGQGIILEEGGRIFKETARGTNFLLNSYQNLRNPSSRSILVKAAKPQQDLRVDLPVIGPITIEKAAEAGVGGIVLEAGKAILLDKKNVSKRANELGLFIYGFTQEK